MYHLPLNLVQLHFMRWIYSSAAELELDTISNLLERIKQQREQDPEWPHFESRIMAYLQQQRELLCIPLALRGLQRCYHFLPFKKSLVRNATIHVS